jgi:hypothetical protein
MKTHAQFEQYLNELSEMELIAGELYTFYCKEAGGKDFNGDPFPLAGELLTDPSKKKHADAWRAVAKRAVMMGFEMTTLAMAKRK